jgi:RNA 2',3'-cyclic 3'-phosphodiesterase
MARLFFALWPDDETRDKLTDVCNQFKNEKVRLVKKSNLHITLEFLGEVASKDQQALIEQAAKIRCKPFDLELTRIGWWQKPAILWIGTTNTPKSLTELVTLIKQSVVEQGLKIDQREYKPHVTIARKVKQAVVPIEKLHIPWHVKSFALLISKSTDSGVEYHVLQEWSLKM